MKTTSLIMLILYKLQNIDRDGSPLASEYADTFLDFFGVERYEGWFILQTFFFVLRLP